MTPKEGLAVLRAKLAPLKDLPQATTRGWRRGPSIQCIPGSTLYRFRGGGFWTQCSEIADGVTELCRLIGDDLARKARTARHCADAYSKAAAALGAKE
jgi:hypothetical protein